MSRVSTSRVVVVFIPALFALLLLSGCPSTVLLNNARPIPVGKNELTFSGSLMTFAASSLGDDSGTSTSSAGILYIPTFAFMYRRGLASFFDLGVALRGNGQVFVDGKFCLLNTKPIAVSLNPGIGGVFVGSGDVAVGYMQFDFPVLIDFSFGKVVTLTVSPKYVGILAFASEGAQSESAFRHLAGGNVAVRFNIGRTFSLMPHGGLVAWVDKPSGYDDVQLLWFTGGLAAKFTF